LRRWRSGCGGDSVSPVSFSPAAFKASILGEEGKGEDDSISLVMSEMRALRSSVVKSMADTA
jgi:hypothetical protein